MTEQADVVKQQGNEAFRTKQYFKAETYYSQAIRLCPETEAKALSILYSNLSATELILEKLSESIDHATKALELDPNNLKGYLRRANALEQSLDWKGAYNDYLALAKQQPNEKRWRTKLDFTKNKFKSKALREAMSSDNLKEDAQEIVEVQTGEPVPIPEFNTEYAIQLMEDLLKDKRPKAAIIDAMLHTLKDQNKQMDNIVKLEHPGVMFVVGDTHGQYQDVVHLFKTYGNPSAEKPYLFNGDYVDRGSMGLEILLVLFAWKLADPNCVYLNRGNHETNMMNAMYGFENECTSKYSKSMFQKFSEYFNTMPLGHIVNGKVLVVHGGLFSDQTVTIESLQTMNRFGQPPESGPLNDILWSDPMEENGFAPSPRGVTRTFGPDVTENFLRRNNLELLIRSHQVQENGYGVMQNGKCITVFSAPNYIGQMGNRGAIVVLEFADDMSFKGPRFEQFVAQPIPPNYAPMRYASFGQFF